MVLSRNQKNDMELRRLQQQETVLPASFLARITAITPASANDEDWLYPVFNLQPVDEVGRDIEGLTINGVQALISLYQPIPDRIYGNAAAVRKTAISKLADGSELPAVAGPSGGGREHTHSPRTEDINHTHEVFTEANIAAWRKNYFGGNGDFSNYLAVVNTTFAGTARYYYIQGFIERTQVTTSLPTPTLPFTGLTVAPDRVVYEVAALNKLPYLRYAQRSTPEGAYLLNESPTLNIGETILFNRGVANSLISTLDVAGAGLTPLPAGRTGSTVINVLPFSVNMLISGTPILASGSTTDSFSVSSNTDILALTGYIGTYSTPAVPDRAFFKIDGSLQNNQIYRAIDRDYPGDHHFVFWRQYSEAE